ncbi:ABC transporter substrate-binding protein [Litorilinea aerophila]|uniref:ABC transporter substrate-binding protein n=1 Tax=Litorilinea aerophila TaxID=1204385 RepID=A0A540VF16_9CHLR|nr:ABC transporter substrate-binding protein [Litorilinea aerophila]MCC9076867.1 ABC transporter substrate-binding protein [Litorilinea aerophila]
MQSRWTLVVTVLLLLAMIGTGCAAPVQPAGAPAAPQEAAAEPAGPRAGGTLTLSLGEDFVTFHPYFDVTNHNIKPTFFEAPIRISDEGTFEPWLAESWEESEDGLSITLHLRQGIKFHNGREMTADDVVWSVEYAMNEELGHHLSDRFQTASGAEKIDDYTVRINYSEVTQSKLDGIARLYIFPQEAAETIETVPVGTGPFKFVEWVPGDQMVAERFEDYWREGLPYLDRVVVKPIPDEQARLVNLKAGSIEALMGVPLIDKAALEQEPGIVVGQTPPGFGFYAFIMNVRTPPFDNVLVRQAMNYAIDRDKIIQTAFHGEAIPVKVPYPPTSWAYAPDLEDYYTYDPERARELLAEAGYPDGFSTEMMIRGTGGPHLDIAQVYQQDLAAIGVQVELLPTELPQYWPKLFDGQFAIVSHATGEATVDPSGLFEGAACCRPFRNFFGITEDDTWFPEYRDVIFQARAESDQAKRKELYHRALEILLEQGWTIPVAWQQDVYAHRDYVKDFRTDMDGLIWLGETWLDR